MQRREFITLLGSAAAAWPLAARAQRLPIPLVGYLGGGTAHADDWQVAALRKGLSEAGYVEGRNVAIEYHLAEGHYDQLPSLAADLVRREVAAIFVAGIPAARAAKVATGTIPIVFSFGEDPVKEGLVASLNRPGGNITGFSHFTNQLIGKRLAMLCEIAPKATVLGFLVDAANPVSGPDAATARSAADALGRKLEVVEVRGVGDVERAFATMAERRVGALAVGPFPLFVDASEQIIALATRYGIPAIYDQRLFTAAGGLASYGADRADSIRQAGVYVGRILKGEKPGELPVQQSTKIEFVVNLKTARAIGLDIPATVVALADEVIE
jgi:putative ABC transport system substrate-binding protein